MDPIYQGMGNRGFSPDEVDRMEMWQVARFLGVAGGPGVIRGTRSLTFGDHDEPEGGGPIDPDTWGMTPDAVAAQDAAKRMAGG